MRPGDQLRVAHVTGLGAIALWLAWAHPGGWLPAVLIAVITAAGELLPRGVWRELGTPTLALGAAAASWAIGALERQVLTQFLVEAVVLALFGGVLGIAIGLGLAAAGSAVMDVPFNADLRVIALAFAVSALIGVIFGYFPARRAARLDPIEALRRE